MGKTRKWSRSETHGVLLRASWDVMRDHTAGSGELMFEARSALERATQIWNLEHDESSKRVFTWGSISSHFTSVSDLQTAALITRFTEMPIAGVTVWESFSEKLDAAERTRGLQRRREAISYAIEDLIKANVERHFRSKVESRWYLWLIAQLGGTERAAELHEIYYMHDYALLDLYRKAIELSEYSLDVFDLSRAITAVIEGSLVRALNDDALALSSFRGLAQLVLHQQAKSQNL